MQKKKKGWLFSRPKPTHKAIYNIYQYNEIGIGRKVGAKKDYKEATSWVSNARALRPNTKYRIVTQRWRIR